MGNIQIYDIRINYLKNPCGLDSDVNISYKIKDFKNGDKQKSVNILVSKNNDFSDVIYNKKFNGDINVFYNVKAKFEPVTKYYVKVVVSTSFGDVCEGKTFFVTGKLNEKWKAKWITGRSHPNHNSPKIQEKIEFIRSDKDNLQAQYIRKKIFVKDEVKESYITICGVGYFDLRINNKTITEDVLSTPFTRFDKTVLYLQYDISKYLKKGNNAVTVILGNGWYNCFAEDPWNTRQASWRSKPRMICEIKVNYESGEKETFRSDDTWLAYNLGGPIYFNGIRNGEHYDARKEMPGWRNVSYNEELWDNVEIIRGPGGNIKACEMQPIKVIKKFKAVDMWKTEDGGYVFDFGQNQAGYCTFKFRGKENTEYTMVYSDIKKEDGDIDIGPIGGFIRSHGFQTDKYTKKSNDEETYHPIFVYHGFQYVKVQGFDYEPKLDDVESNAICSGFDIIGDFSCSDELLNKLQHLCVWSSLSNMESIPTDCPHREKNGWTGDASISSEQMVTNFDSRAFFKKWNNDIRDAQRENGLVPCVIPSTGWGYNSMNGPDWSSAVINVPYNIYLYNDDINILKESYDVIKKHCDFMETMTVDYTLNYGLGDWCAPFEGPAISKNMGSFKCPTEVTDTAFFYNASCIVEKIANILGKKDDEKYYHELSKKIKEAFRNKYFDKEKFLVKGDCQTSTAVMLYFGLYNNKTEYFGLVNKLLEQIKEKDDHLDFGILGCKFVMNALGKAGYGYVGQKMIAQKTFPGCQRWIDLGATTLWECWNGGGSHNHHMFSDLSSFMYKYVAGISPDEDNPGFKNTIFRPALKSGMTYAKAKHESMFGDVEIDWQLKDNAATIELTVPFSCTGELHLPIEYSNKIEVKELSKVNIQKNKGEYIVYLGSGKYTIEAERK